MIILWSAYYQIMITLRSNYDYIMIFLTIFLGVSKSRLFHKISNLKKQKFIA